MSESIVGGREGGGLDREEAFSGLFAQMLLQQANLAMMLLGKTPHPQTGQSMRDIEGARMFIDQLEMLEAKTKGNLSKEEEALLKQSLMSLRLAFVEAVEAAPSPPPAPAPNRPTPAPKESPGNAPPPDSETSEAESKKKFSKKY